MALILYGTPHAQMAAGALLAALVTGAAIAAGVVMGNRLHQGEPPVPSVSDLDHELSGGNPQLAEELQEQLEQIDLDYYDPRPAAFQFSAEETRPRNRHRSGGTPQQAE